MASKFPRVITKKDMERYEKKLDPRTAVELEEIRAERRGG